MDIKINIEGIVINTPSIHNNLKNFAILIEDIGGGSYQVFYCSQDRTIGFNEWFLNKNDLDYYFAESGWEIDWKVKT